MTAKSNFMIGGDMKYVMKVYEYVRFILRKFGEIAEKQPLFFLRQEQGLLLSYPASPFSQTENRFSPAGRRPNCEPASRIA